MKYKVKKKKNRKQRSLFLKPFQLPRYSVTRGSYPMFFLIFPRGFSNKRDTARSPAIQVCAALKGKVFQPFWS